MKISLVVSLQPAHFDSVAFQGGGLTPVEAVARLGYDGVELAVRDPAKVDLPALEAALTRYGLTVPAIGTGQAWGEEGLSFTDPAGDVRAAAVRRFRQHIDLAARWRALVIVGLIRGRAQPGVGQAQALTWLADALRECAEAALTRGVELVLEPINRYETNLVNTIDEALTLLDQVGAPNIGVLADTFHMNIEEAWPEASLRRAGGDLRHVHVADSNRRYPGAGHLDFERLLATLTHELHYQGWLSAEIQPEPDAWIAAERGLAHLRRCLG